MTVDDRDDRVARMWAWDDAEALLIPHAQRLYGSAYRDYIAMDTLVEDLVDRSVDDLASWPDAAVADLLACYRVDPDDPDDVASAAWNARHD